MTDLIGEENIYQEIRRKNVIVIKTVVLNEQNLFEGGGLKA